MRRASGFAQSPAFIPELDFIAVRNGEIVGNIVYSRAKVVDKARMGHEVLTSGPISVLPSCQRQGIGSRLIEHTKVLAADLGCKAVVIFGNPAYYHRFGFRNAAGFSIATAEGENLDAFMALELYEGALRGISGRFYEDPVFHVDPKELESFEKNFPPKEKHVTDTQLK
jgi:predicted N-acetyltransferase YhbS